MKKILIATTALLLISAVKAQTNFLSTGKIVFEKKLSQHRMIDEDDDNEGESEWKTQLKKQCIEAVQLNSLPDFVEQDQHGTKRLASAKSNNGAPLDTRTKRQRK